MKWSDTEFAKRFVKCLPLSVLIKSIFEEGKNLYFFGVRYQDDSNLSLAYFYEVNGDWRVSRKEFLEILDAELNLREHNWNIARRELEQFYDVVTD